MDKEDSQQIEAILAPLDKDILCLASAGSGKTRTLVERIAHLINDCQVSPYEIMAVSFTRKASNELKERLVRRLGEHIAYKISCGTIHSIALRYLRRFGDLIGWKAKHLTVYSQFEEDFLLKEVAMDLGVYNGKAWKPSKREIQAMFDTYYQEGETPPDDHPCRRVFDELTLRCRENNSMTYGGLLVAFRSLIPQITQYLNFKHIFVDEVQDLDALQHHIFKMLSTRCKASLYYVGDLDQVAYAWRGAVPEYLINHHSEFQIFKIESNYRSCPEIVNAANKLIERNTVRLPRTMVPARYDMAGIVSVYRDMDSDKIVKTIFNLGIKGKEIAILGRNHFLLKKISAKMDEAGMEYTYVGRESEFVESLEFRTFHAFLKLLVNPYDNFSMLLIRDILGIPRKEYNGLRLWAAKESKSHFEVWFKSVLSGVNPKRDFFYDSGRPDFDLKETVSNLFVCLGRSEKADEIDDFIRSYQERGGENTVRGYLDWLSTYDLQDEIRDDDPKMQLSTIHAAKGLEWPCVMIIGCNEGLLPSKQAVEAGREEIEKERNLMYIASTRARDALLLAVRPERKEDDRGKVYENPVSRFIQEML